MLMVVRNITVCDQYTFALYVSIRVVPMRPSTHSLMTEESSSLTLLQSDGIYVIGPPVNRSEEVVALVELLLCRSSLLAKPSLSAQTLR